MALAASPASPGAGLSFDIWPVFSGFHSSNSEKNGQMSNIEWNFKVGLALQKLPTPPLIMQYKKQCTVEINGLCYLFFFLVQMFFVLSVEKNDTFYFLKFDRSSMVLTYHLRFLNFNEKHPKFMVIAY